MDVRTTALDVDAIRTRAGLKPRLARGTEAGDAEDLVERVVGESDVRGGLAMSALFLPFPGAGACALSAPLHPHRRCGGTIELSWRGGGRRTTATTATTTG